MDRGTYHGIPTRKMPIDFWIYLEIMFKVKPDVVVEIGNQFGGSTLALAHALDNIGKGKVIAVDISHRLMSATHPRITLITGDATQMIDEVKALISPTDTVLVIEDSSHTYANTLSVLRNYSKLVTKDSYIIVEDSIVNHGIDYPALNPGPFEAIDDFLKETDSFVPDLFCERYGISWNVRGYLKKVKDV
jgi:cephalosporin hydroxylase